MQTFVCINCPVSLSHRFKSKGFIIKRQNVSSQKKKCAEFVRKELETGIQSFLILIFMMQVSE